MAMAPAIDFSLREYAINQVRERERSMQSGPSSSYTANLVARDQWLSLQDWTEDPDTLAPFDEADENIGKVLQTLRLFLENHAYPELTEAYNTLTQAAWQVADARSVITNLTK